MQLRNFLSFNIPVPNMLGLIYLNLCLSLVPSGIFAQGVKDRVVVMASTPTKINTREVGHVYEGEIHTISAVNGQWCALEDIEGWIPLKNVNYLNKALQHFTDRINKNKNDFAAYAHRGMIHYENRNYEKAFDDLFESLKLNPRNAVTWNNRGKVLLAQQKPSLALQDAKKAIELNPGFPLAHFNLGRIYHALQDWENAVAAYDQAIKLNPRLSNFHLNRGNSRMMIGDYDLAEIDFNKALEINNKKPDAYVGLSNLWLAREKTDKAFDFADRAVKLAPTDAFALNARGWSLYKLGRPKEAIDDLTRAISTTPRFSLAFNNRGVCYAELGLYEKAVVDYSQAIKLNSNDTIALTNRGNAWFQLGDFEKAKNDFQKVVDLNANLIEGSNSFAWFLATCPDPDFRNGSLALEIAQRNQQLQEQADWSSLRTLAAALAETGEFEQAIEVAEQAYQAAPEKEKELLSSVLDLFRQGKSYQVSVAAN